MSNYIILQPTQRHSGQKLVAINFTGFQGNNGLTARQSVGCGTHFPSTPEHSSIISIDYSRCLAEKSPLLKLSVREAKANGCGPSEPKRLNVLIPEYYFHDCYEDHNFCFDIERRMSLVDVRID